MTRHKITVTKRQEKGRITWTYSEQDTDKYGYALCGADNFTNATGSGGLYGDSVTVVFYGNARLKIEKEIGTHNGKQYPFPTFAASDTAAVRAAKLAERIESIHKWISDCNDADAKESGSATAELSESATFAYVQRMTSKVFEDKKPTSEDDVPF